MSLARKLVALALPLCMTHCGAGPPESAQGSRGEPPAGQAWLEIDRTAFESNLRALQARVGPKTMICAVMKADAYGHGIKLLAPSVAALGIPYVGITSNVEARAVRESGFDRRILRLRTATLQEIEDGLGLDLEELTGNLEQARLVSELARRRGRAIRLHLNLNSGGMSRNGIELSTPHGRQDALEILKLPRLEIVGIMTHFPVEDRDDVLRGLAAFHRESEWVIRNGNLDRRKLILHTANSFAALEVPESRLDIVRVGGALYGDTVPKYTEYKRVMEFKSRVAAVNSYPAGNSVGYDRTWVLKRDSRLANVPAGYSDGYRRSLSNQGHVLIRGRRCPVVGRVSMNTIMADVTDLPEVRPGDEVVLFGKQGTVEITQDELEKGAGTIFAEIYTVWASRCPRILKRD